MEYTDPVVAREELPESETPVDATTTETNEKTQDAIHRLESDIDSAYSSIESKFSALWSSASQNAQGILAKVDFEQRRKELMEQLNAAKANINNNKLVQDNVQSIEKQLKTLGEQVKALETKVDLKKLSTQANSALDTLDSKLEIVEQQAGKYMNQFTSFFSSMIALESSTPSPAKEQETLFSSSALYGAAYGSSRYETDLFKLHTTESYYLDDTKDVAAELGLFNVEEKTLEIGALLQKYPETLEKLMNKLVPVQIPYNVFWYRYFKAEAEVKTSEQSRKELLTKKDTSKVSSPGQGSDEEEDEEFTWDDDEDEDEEVVKVEKNP